MKFSLFVHMERWDDSVSHRQLFEDLTELTLMAEAGGFSTVWIGEHHSMEYTISPSPMPQLAYLAARTERIRLGAGTIIAPFWNPLRVAGECALLDVISNGRMEVGLARGAYQFEFDRMAGGIPASSGGTHLRELVPAVQALWQGDYAHDGEIWQFPTSTSVPKPIQRPGPPVWIAARDPDSHDFAVRSGCNVMVTPLMKGDEEVLDLTKATPVDGFLEPSPESKFEGRPEFEPESLHKTAMIGTPEEVVERIRYYQELGVDEFSFWCDNSLPHEEKKKSLALFVEHVVPAFAQT